MENKETILKLYNYFIDDIYAMLPENKELLLQKVALENKLNKILTDEQKELLDKIDEMETKRVENVYKEVFVFAYSLATKLIIEGLDKE